MPPKTSRNRNAKPKRSPEPTLLVPSSTNSGTDSDLPSRSSRSLSPSPLLRTVEPPATDSDMEPDSAFQHDGRVGTELLLDLDYGPAAFSHDNDDPDRAVDSPRRKDSGTARSSKVGSSIGVSAADSGHTMMPTLSRDPTFLETVSRTMRAYAPPQPPMPSQPPSPSRLLSGSPTQSRPRTTATTRKPPPLHTSSSRGRSSTANHGRASIPVPRGTPSSPTVSFGGFLGSPSNSQRQADMNPYESQFYQDGKHSPPRSRRVTADSNPRRGTADPWAQERLHPEVILDQADDYDEPIHSPGLSTYPGMRDRRPEVEGERVLWARWDSIADKRILILGYARGLQIWDCSTLGSVSELLNLPPTQSELGRIIYGAVLPHPSGEQDVWSMERPLLGLVTQTQADGEAFALYSLSSHRVVHRIPQPGLFSFIANEHYIVFSTANPTTLHVISTTSFATLLTVPSTSLVPVPVPSPLRSTYTPFNINNRTSHSHHTNKANNNNVSTPDILETIPHALSHRLLAYASPTPRSDAPSPITHGHARSASSGLNANAELVGNAALRVGGTVLSGMKTLGGMAYSAAKARATGVPLPESKESTKEGSGSGISSLFFSKSAPAGGSGEQERRHSGTSFAPYEPAGSQQARPAGHFVTVLDLRTTPPTTVAEFVASKHQPIARLDFTSDGTSLVVSPRDGQVMNTFRLRPKGPCSARTGSGEEFGEAWHIYDLRRGHTSAVVEGLSVAQDGRWVAVGTRKRTVHVFAVNPYGGKPDERSHLDGHVRNPPQIPPLGTEVSPIVRLRVAKPAPLDQACAPLAFTFVQSSEFSVPTNLLPAPALNSVGSSRSSPLSHTEQLSPRPTNFQDVLVFDPLDGVLSLRRIALEVRAEQGYSIAAGTSATSISLPGMSSLGRLGVSASPPKSIVERPAELAGVDSTIATWSLKRRLAWPAVKHAVTDAWDAALPRERIAKTDWLAQAELSTYAQSSRISPRPIYLAHQFSFHTLGEDYHALIRSYQFDISGTKLDVRKEVEVSGYLGTGESFVEGFSTQRDVRRASSSFDEPLASAISAGLDYQSTPAVLPMLPNGTFGSQPKSFRNTIPIRTMATSFGDGMTEGIGRIRREMHRVRSAQFNPRPDRTSIGSDSVPLVFDEEDEDFVARDDLKIDGRSDGMTSRTDSRGDDTQLLATPPPANATEPSAMDEEDPWSAWGGDEDLQVVADAERFEDISVVGFLDEEQAEMVQAEKTKKTKKTRSKKQHRAN